MANINWQKYNEIFPDRYLRSSLLDEKILHYIEIMRFLFKRELVILDIGGGVCGSIPLEQQPKNHCYLLDPFIEKCPENYIAKVDYDTNIKFDIIICRGAFNYLSTSEIKKIPSFLNEYGLFIFNTFNEPTENRRPYTKNGIDVGIEETLLLKYIPTDEGTISILKHFLYPNEGEPIIHDMIYYRPSDILKFFQSNYITVESYGNSAYYIIRK